jgi:hypothetical protein
MPTEDPLQQRWFQIVCSIAILAFSWMMWRSVTHDAQIQALQYQIQTLVQLQGNVIPPVVESSLREIRDKTNSDREMIAKLTEIAVGNSKDIGYLKENSRKP